MSTTTTISSNKNDKEDDRTDTTHLHTPSTMTIEDYVGNDSVELATQLGVLM